MKYSAEIRKNAGLTQARLAELGGISRAFLARVETGKQNLSNALDLLLYSLCTNLPAGNEATHSHVKIDSQELHDDSALEARVKALEADVSQLKTTIINILTRMGE